VVDNLASSSAVFCRVRTPVFRWETDLRGCSEFVNGDSSDSHKALFQALGEFLGPVFITIQQKVTHSHTERNHS